jgi:gliding motility-associated lipoprotein GldB
MIRFLYLVIILPFVLFSCETATDGIERPDVSDVPVEVKITRLERQLFSSDSKSEINAFLQENKSFAQNFLQIDEYPHDSILVNQLSELMNNPAIDTLYQDSQKIFGDMEDIRQEFETAFRYIKYYYPDFTVPEVYTIVTGFANDLYVSDEMIVIGLDYFAGPEATYRPMEVPNYIKRRYTPGHLVPTCILLLSQQFNSSDPQDKTLLADMIYYGKSYYFTDFVMPNKPDSLIIGYTAEEMEGVNANEHVIWTHFLKNELLYENNHTVKKKYLDERPTTFEIGNKAPGRIGTWLGWQIVKAYMRENDEITLPQLMDTANARKILDQSKYRPGS